MGMKNKVVFDTFIFKLAERCLEWLIDFDFGFKIKCQRNASIWWIL